MSVTNYLFSPRFKFTFSKSWQQRQRRANVYKWMNERTVIHSKNIWKIVKSTNLNILSTNEYLYTLTSFWQFRWELTSFISAAFKNVSNLFYQRPLFQSVLNDRYTLNFCIKNNPTLSTNTKYELFRYISTQIKPTQTAHAFLNDHYPKRI